MASAGMVRFDATGRLSGANAAFHRRFDVTGAPDLAALLEMALRAGWLGDPDGSDSDTLAARLVAGEMVPLRAADGVWLGLTLADEGLADEGLAGGDLAGGRVLTLAELGPAHDRLRRRQIGEKQELLETTFDAMEDAVVGFDRDLRLVVCNRLYGIMFRLPAALMRPGTGFGDIVRFMVRRGDYGAVDPDAYVAEREAVARRADTFDFRFTLSDGKVYDTRHSPLPGGGFLRRYSDLSAQARVEEAQSAIFEAIAFPLVVTRLSDGLVMAANQPTATLFELPMEAIIGQAIAKDFHDDISMRNAMLERLREVGDGVDVFESRLRTATGRVFWALLSARVFLFQGTEAILTCVNDITHLKRIEQELAASRELFEMAIRAARDGISRLDLATGELWFSPQWWALLGYGEGEMVNTSTRWNELILEEDRAPSLRLMEDYVAGRVDECQLVQRFRHKRGHVVHLFTRAIKITDGQGRAVRLVGAHTDITERIRGEETVRAAKEQAERALRELQEAQEHLIQSEKMAALGSLVAGVAHEINTPVGIALTGASLLAERTGDLRKAFEAGNLRRPDFADFIETAGEATELMLVNIDRAAQLIQSFKQMAVDQSSEERRGFDLGDYVREVLRSLGVRLRRARHEVLLSCPEGLVVDSYPGALSQVLTNFVMNSLTHAYAPDEGGRLTVTITRPNADEVELVYADDGRGIPAHLHGRVFEPFFTTNRASGGSGLGLNIVYNIVTRTLRGRIALSSEEGRGTTFTLRLPRVVPEEARGESR